MKPSFLVTFLIIIISSCGQTEEKQKVILAREFDTEYKIDSTVRFQNVRQVAYGYKFSYPITFQEIIDTIRQVDSLILYSADKRAKIKFFVEGNTSMNKDLNDKTEQKYVSSYFDSLHNGKHILTRNSKVMKSQYGFSNYSYGNTASFMLLGQRDTIEYFFKTELSEVPISGDLIFKNFFIEYPKTLKSYYRPVAIQIAKNFGQ